MEVPVSEVPAVWGVPVVLVPVASEVPASEVPVVLLVPAQKVFWEFHSSDRPHVCPGTSVVPA